MSLVTSRLAPVALLGVMLSAMPAAGELLTRKTESGTIVGYKDTPLTPWTGDKYHVHDPDCPVPTRLIEESIIAPKQPSTTPSNATVLFDGKDLSAWKPSSWKVADGAVTAGHGSLETKEAFGDCQIYLQWMTPTTISGNLMNRGNSGVLIMGRYEIQIFDSHPMHADQIYPDGQAASLYGQAPPLVNACRKPGEWQSFDIRFTAPVFEGDKLIKPASVNVWHNGVRVHRDQVVHGPMAHRRIAPYQPHPAKLPLVLQGHGSPVQFRDIWIRPLNE